MLRRACVLVFALLCCLVAIVTSAPSVQTLPAIEGGNVTFWTGLSSQTHAILSYDNVTLLNYDNGDILEKQNNIYVENKTIIMTNIHRSDSNHMYKLQIVSPAGETYNYKLNVTKWQPQVSEKRDHTTAAYIVVGLVVAGVVGLIIYWQRENICKICGKSPSEKQWTNLTN